MNKRKSCTVLAIGVSLLFTLGYFAFFAGINVQPEINVVQEVNQEELKPLTLYWIQLGVFKEESSYISLIQNCENAGIEIVCVDYDDKVVIVAQCCLDETERQKALEKLNNITKDYLLKEKRFIEEQALIYLKEKNMEKVLEEFVYR